MSSDIFALFRKIDYNIVMRLKPFVFAILILFITTTVFAQETDNTNTTSDTQLNEPAELQIFRKAFPDTTFTATYSERLEDWLVTVSCPTTPVAAANPATTSKRREITFCWCEGRLIPEAELKRKSHYLPVLEEYPFGGELQSPATYTQAQIEQYRQAGLASARKNEPFASQFLSDFMYYGSSRKSVEQHLARIKFLGHKVTVNEFIVEPLTRVEKRILEERKTSTVIDTFLKGIDHMDGYNWREIRDVERKSLHGTAIAIDFLPIKMNKYMYWRWTKDILGDKWMLASLKSRWMPPYEIINIFEEEGFIWGGKWLIWDNMHFEYRPELIEFYKQTHTEKQ